MYLKYSQIEFNQVGEKDIKGIPGFSAKEVTLRFY
jgi:hypothetical protein